MTSLKEFVLPTNALMYKLRSGWELRQLHFLYWLDFLSAKKVFGEILSSGLLVRAIEIKYLSSSSSSSSNCRSFPNCVFRICACQPVPLLKSKGIEVVRFHPIQSQPCLLLLSEKETVQLMQNADHSRLCFPNCACHSVPISKSKVDLRLDASIQFFSGAALFSCQDKKQCSLLRLCLTELVPYVSLLSKPRHLNIAFGPRRVCSPASPFDVDQAA
eukprot:535785-Pelagomonas_calceolata.AAC.5